MAAARKSFRGGRPVKLKPCPRCGTPCSSAVQAAPRWLLVSVPAIGDYWDIPAQGTLLLLETKSDAIPWHIASARSAKPELVRAYGADSAG
jgi:hypothetical protein